MKKLMMAAILAGSVFAMTADCVAEEAQPAADATAQQTCKKAKKAKLTPEERKAMMMKKMNERKAAIEAKSIEIIKKYGLDDEKAKALFNELQEAMKSAFGRRPRPAKAPKAE